MNALWLFPTTAVAVVALTAVFAAIDHRQERRRRHTPTADSADAVAVMASVGITRLENYLRKEAER